jgi:hypothetical protein
MNKRATASKLDGYEMVGKPANTGKREKKPIIAYYQTNENKSNHPKVRVLKPGDEIVGTYVHTFVDKGEDGEKDKLNYLIETSKGNVTVKGYTVLNDRMMLVTRNTPVRIVYVGVGESSKKGRKPPFLFEVYRQKASDLQDTSDLDTESDDSEDENDPF